MATNEPTSTSAFLKQEHRRGFNSSGMFGKECCHSLRDRTPPHTLSAYRLGPFRLVCHHYAVQFWCLLAWWSMRQSGAERTLLLGERQRWRLQRYVPVDQTEAKPTCVTGF